MGYMVEDRFTAPRASRRHSASDLVTQVQANRHRRSGYPRKRVCVWPRTRRRTLRGSGPCGRRRPRQRHRARAGIRRHGMGLWPDRPCLRHRTRQTAPRHRTPVLHAARAARDPAASGQPLLHRLVGNRPTPPESTAMPDAAYLDHLRPRFGSFLGDIRLAGKRFSYPLSLSLANSMTAPRVALCGDAAHGVHPIAGQGLNAGLRDVAALAEVLTDAARRGEDIGSADVLDRYQRWRRFDTAALRLPPTVQPAVFQRQPAAADRARHRDGRGPIGSRASPRLHPRGGRPHRRPAPADAGPPL
jgi:hypothetical protein